jgi:hypothetical protein
LKMRSEERCGVRSWWSLRTLAFALSDMGRPWRVVNRKVTSSHLLLKDHPGRCAEHRWKGNNGEQRLNKWLWHPG